MKLPEELAQRVERLVQRFIYLYGIDPAALATRAAEIALEWASGMVCVNCGRSDDLHKCSAAEIVRHGAPFGLVTRAQYLAEREREER